MNNYELNDCVVWSEGQFYCRRCFCAAAARAPLSGTRHALPQPAADPSGDSATTILMAKRRTSVTDTERGHQDFPRRHAAFQRNRPHPAAAAADHPAGAPENQQICSLAAPARAPNSLKKHVDNNPEFGVSVHEHDIRHANWPTARRLLQNSSPACGFRCRKAVTAPGLARRHPHHTGVEP